MSCCHSNKVSTSLTSRRAWTVSGLALRHALTLGLHVRSKTRSLSDVDKEYRVRLFWSLYDLERLLNQLTGRPSCVSPRDISADLPLNVDGSSFDRAKRLYAESQHTGDANEAGERRDTRDQSNEIRRKSETRSRQHSREDEGSPMDITPQTVNSAGGSPDSEDSSSPSVHGPPRLQVTDSTYFIYWTRLAIISHDIFNDLYSPSMVSSKWSEIQKIIRRVDRKLKAWRHSLPWEFDFEADGPKPYTPNDNKSPNTYSLDQQRWEYMENQRIGLSLLWNSARMILYRPTLCRLKHQIPKESERSKDFNASAAETCIGCARNIIACLPTKNSPRSRVEMAYSPDTESMYRLTPWWNTIHYIIESASVLMLELAYRAEHVPSQAEEVLEDAKRAVGWMKALAPQSVAAKKGYVVYEILLRRVAPKVGHFVGRLTCDGDLPKGEEGNDVQTRPALTLPNGQTSSDFNTTHSPTHRRRPSYQRTPSYHYADAHPHASATTQWASTNSHPNQASSKQATFLPQTQEPRQTMQKSDRHFYGLPPLNAAQQAQAAAQPPQPQPQQHQMTTAAESQSYFSQTPTTAPQQQPIPDIFSGLGSGGMGFGLDALQAFQFAGGVYGRYDEFGPWLEGIETFIDGGFDQLADPGTGGYAPQEQGVHLSVSGAAVVDSSGNTSLSGGNVVVQPQSQANMTGMDGMDGMQQQLPVSGPAGSNQTNVQAGQEYCFVPTQGPVGPMGVSGSYQTYGVPQAQMGGQQQQPQQQQQQSFMGPSGGVLPPRPKYPRNNGGRG